MMGRRPAQGRRADAGADRGADPAAGVDHRRHRLRRRRRGRRRPAHLRRLRGARLRGRHRGHGAELARGERGAHHPPETVAAQIETVATDIGLDAAKTGMLATTEIIEAVAAACDRTGIGAGGRTPFVVDPVAASMSGDPLLAGSALDAYRTLMFPRATVVTPNLDEVRLLVGVDVHDRRRAVPGGEGAARSGLAVRPGQGRAPGARTRTVRGPALRRRHLHRAARPAVRHRQHARRRGQHGRGDRVRAGPRAVRARRRGAGPAVHGRRPCASPTRWAPGTVRFLHCGRCGRGGPTTP